MVFIGVGPGLRRSFASLAAPGPHGLCRRCPSGLGEASLPPRSPAGSHSLCRCRKAPDDSQHNPRPGGPAQRESPISCHCVVPPGLWDVADLLRGLTTPAWAVSSLRDWGSRASHGAQRHAHSKESRHLECACFHHRVRSRYSVSTHVDSAWVERFSDEGPALQRIRSPAHPNDVRHASH